MKSRFRLSAAVAIAILLSVQVSAVSARPHHGIERDVPSKIVKLIQKLQKLFGVSTHEDLPVPPRP